MRYWMLLASLLLSAPAWAQDTALFVVVNRTAQPVQFSTKPHTEQTLIPANGTGTHRAECTKPELVCWGARSSAHAWGFTSSPAFCIPCGNTERLELTDYGVQQ
jgi:hypothetical protein